MEKNWTKIFSSSEMYKVGILKGKLEAEGIEAVLINRRDSSYLSFGVEELYVNKDNVMKALQIINKSNENDF